MEWVILLFIIASIYVAYKIGEKEGIKRVNRDLIDVGTWIEIVKPVNYKPNENSEQKKIPIGTQGIVTGKGNWPRNPDSHINIWIAYPWSKEWKHPQLYQIIEYEKLRIMPEEEVGNDEKKTTLEALGKWEK